MIRDILEEGYQVNLRMQVPVEVEPGEYPDSQKTRIAEDRLFKFLTDYLRKDFLLKTVSFPKNGIAEVDLGIDMVCIKGDDYRRIMDKLDKYEQFYEEGPTHLNQQA